MNLKVVRIDKEVVTINQQCGQQLWEKNKLTTRYY